MPVCATASAMADVLNFAASCLIFSRWPEDIGVDRLHARELLQALFENGHFFVAVHPLDPEDRFGMDLTDLTRDGHYRRSSATWRSACWKRSRT